MSLLPSGDLRCVHGHDPQERQHDGKNRCARCVTRFRPKQVTDERLRCTGGATIALSWGEALCCGLWQGVLSLSGWVQRRCRHRAGPPPVPVDRTEMTGSAVGPGAACRRGVACDGGHAGTAGDFLEKLLVPVRLGPGRAVAAEAPAEPGIPGTGATSVHGD